MRCVVLLVVVFLVFASSSPARLPAQDAPAQDPPAQTLPVQDAPADEPPAQTLPVQDAPADEPPAQNLATQGVSSADTATTGVSPSGDAPTIGVAGPARLEYERVFREWKQLLKSMRDLAAQFSIAETEETLELRNKFQAELERGRVLLPLVRQAAMAAYDESPGTDVELTRFLVKLLDDEVARDDFEPALELGDLLIKHGPEDKSVYDLASVAAYALNEFDKAQSYLREAESQSVLNKGAKFLATIPEVRTAWEAEQLIRAAEVQADDLPRVKLQTSKGTIVVELFENEAPETVGNFISLVKKGFYDGLFFHRVLPNFMAQGGDPRGDGTGGPGYMIYCECLTDKHRNHFRGSLSMAKSAEPNTGGSQFFITFLPTAHLNGAHTVFGRVIEGIDVLTLLQRRNPDDGKQSAITPDRIIKAEVIRDRGHEYKPNPVQRG